MSCKSYYTLTLERKLFRLMLCKYEELKTNLFIFYGGHKLANLSLRTM